MSTENEPLPHDVFERDAAHHYALLHETAVRNGRGSEHEPKALGREFVGISELGHDATQKLLERVQPSFVPPPGVNRPCGIADRGSPLFPHWHVVFVEPHGEARGDPPAESEGHPNVKRIEQRFGLDGREGCTVRSAQFDDVSYEVDVGLVQVLPDVVEVRTPVNRDLPASHNHLPATIQIIVLGLDRLWLRERWAELGQFNQWVTMRVSSAIGSPPTAPFVQPLSASRWQAGRTRSRPGRRSTSVTSPPTPR